MDNLAEKSWLRLDNPIVEDNEAVLFGPYDYIRITNGRICMSDYYEKSDDVLYINEHNGGIFYDGAWFRDAVIIGLTDGIDVSIFPWGELRQRFNEKKAQPPHLLYHFNVMDIPNDVFKEAVGFIKINRSVAAVKSIRAAMNCKLLEAKEAMEQIRDKIRGFK